MSEIEVKHCYAKFKVESKLNPIDLYVYGLGDRHMVQISINGYEMIVHWKRCAIDEAHYWSMIDLPSELTGEQKTIRVDSDVELPNGWYTEMGPRFQVQNLVVSVDVIPYGDREVAVHITIEKAE